MTTFESKAVIHKPLNAVYSFLANMNNHEQLMPDNISNWSSTKDEASFSVQNLINLAIKITNRIENESIIIESAEIGAPFKTEIRWVVSDYGNQTTLAVLTISAELNMMLKMLASSPLQKLTEHQTHRLQHVI